MKVTTQEQARKLIADGYTLYSDASVRTRNLLAGAGLLVGLGVGMLAGKLLF